MDPIQIVLQTAIEPMQAVLPTVLAMKTARTDVTVVQILSAKVRVHTYYYYVIINNSLFIKWPLIPQNEDTTTSTTVSTTTQPFENKSVLVLRKKVRHSWSSFTARFNLNESRVKLMKVPITAKKNHFWSISKVIHKKRFNFDSELIPKFMVLVLLFFKANILFSVVPWINVRLVH